MICNTVHAVLTGLYHVPVPHQRRDAWSGLLLEGPGALSALRYKGEGDWHALVQRQDGAYLCARGYNSNHNNN